jgi:hypothetical protein
MRKDEELLRRSKPLTEKEAEAAEQEWRAGPATSWAKDWDNEQTLSTTPGGSIIIYRSDSNGRDTWILHRFSTASELWYGASAGKMR